MQDFGWIEFFFIDSHSWGEDAVYSQASLSWLSRQGPKWGNILSNSKFNATQRGYKASAVCHTQNDFRLKWGLNMLSLRIRPEWSVSLQALQKWTETTGFSLQLFDESCFSFEWFHSFHRNRFARTHRWLIHWKVLWWNHSVKETLAWILSTRSCNWKIWMCTFTLFNNH